MRSSPTGPPKEKGGRVSSNHTESKKCIRVHSWRSTYSLSGIHRGGQNPQVGLGSGKDLVSHCLELC